MLTLAAHKLKLENTVLHILHNLKVLVKSLLEETIVLQHAKIYKQFGIK